MTKEADLRRGKWMDGVKTYAVEALARSIEIDFPEEYLQQIALAAANEVTLVLAGNHAGHADLMALAEIADRIRGKTNQLIGSGNYQRKQAYPGVVVPMAGTAVTGEQSPDVTTGISTIMPWLSAKGTYPIPVMRERDRQVYQTADQAVQTAQIKVLWRMLSEGFGLGIMIAGTVQESRLDRWGQPVGMARVNEQNLYTLLLEKRRKQHRPVLIIPVGYQDTARILDPDSRKITGQAKQAAVRQSILPIRAAVRQLARAKVGKPIMADELWERMPEGENRVSWLNNVTLAMAAQLIEPGRRGEFDDEVLGYYLGTDWRSY